MRRYGLRAAADFTRILSFSPTCISIIRWGWGAGASTYVGPRIKHPYLMITTGILGLSICLAAAIIPITSHESIISAIHDFISSILPKSPPKKCPTWIDASSPANPLDSRLAASSGTLKTELSISGDYSIRKVAFSRGGSTIAAVAEQSSNTNSANRIYLWNAKHLKNPTLLPDTQSNNYGTSTAVDLAFSPAGNFLAASDTNGLDVWDLGSCTDSYNSAILPSAITYIPGEAAIVTIDEGDRGEILDPNTGWSRIPKPLSGNNSTSWKYTQIAASRGGADIATTAATGTLTQQAYIWDRENGRRYGPISAQQQLTAVNSVDFNPNGNILAIAGIGATKLWSTGRHTYTYLWSAINTTPQAEAFSPNGTTLAVGDSDGNIYLWNIYTHRVIGTIRCPIGDWQGLTFSPDGRTLAAYARRSSRIYIYHVNYQPVRG